MIRLFNTACSDQEVATVESVLRSGNLVMGKHVQALEQELAGFIKGEDGFVTCASGTDALTMCLEELGCQNTSVVVPAMTFSATYEAVLKAGASPVVVDVDDAHLTPTVEQINQKIIDSIYDGKVVAGVILVHLYGWPAHETEEIADFCKQRGLILIEDCAQAFGARFGNKFVGTFGDAAAFSFYPTKPLGGIGDGGAAYFPIRGVADVARARRTHGRVVIRNNGLSRSGPQEFPGYNSRLDEANAAVLRLRLARYDDTLRRRRVLCSRYNANGLRAFRRGDYVPSPYVFPTMADNRERAMFHLAEAGFETRVHYDPPASELPYVGADCPNAGFAAKKILSLPCHENMTEADVDRICDEVRRD